MRKVSLDTKRGEIVAAKERGWQVVVERRIGRILSGPFRGAFRLKSDLRGSVINLG